MISFSDFLMYCKYYKKRMFLAILKRKKCLDFTGRREDSNPDFRGYEGCYPIDKILKKLHITNEDNFLDLGCGKGLALYYAKAFEFSKICGVEYSLDIYNCAKDNISLLNDNRLSIVNCDARDFSEYGKYNIFFFNNPFGKDIMQEVATKIIESRQKNAKRTIIIYQFPFSVQVFLNKGFKVIYEKNPNIILDKE